MSERLASPQLQALLRRRLAELGGLALAALACAMLVALLSYNPGDPSPDTATVAHSSNFAGPVGAAFADLMLQYFGLAGVLPALALLAWAWRVVSHGGLGSLTLRVVCLVCAMPAAAAALGGAAILLGRSPAWPSRSGPGGGLGSGLAQAAIEAGRSAAGPFGGVLIWGLILALVLMLVPLCLGLSWSEWRAFGRGARRAGSLPLAMGRRSRAGGKSRAAMAGRRKAGRRVPDPADPADDEDFDHVLPGLSPFGAQMRAAGLRTGIGTAGEVAPPGTSGGLGALVPRAAEEEAPSRRSRARKAAERQEPSLRGGRRDEPAVSRPRLTGITGWVMPPGQNEEQEDLPALPMRSQSALRAARVAPEDAALHRTHAGDAPPDVPARTGPAATETAPRTGSALLSIGRLLGGGRGGDDGGARREDRATDTPAPRRREVPHHEAHGWQLPPLSLLKMAPPRSATGPSEESLNANARLLETVLSDYGVQGAIGAIHTGPVVTLYELEPAPGIRSARVIGLADDIARSLSVTAVRIATVPGRNVIGIEVPNARRETVFYSELLDSEAWHEHPSRLCLALGKDISGAPVFADLARMPHLLIAGTTGSGKSVGINSMILSLLYRLSPDECRLIMIDPKMLELSIYDGIPHLMAPVVTEPAKAVTALKWTVREMERRYRAMSQLGVRNVGGYNERLAMARASGESMNRRVQTGFDPETGKPIFEEQPLSLEPLPYIVVVIDEMADLMMVAGKEIEAAVQRLAQMARAAGIHVIMATQRPSVDVITGTIKANFPTRISFQVISKFDSRTILGEQGAEQLLGQGDMLYMAGGGRITRVHGPFVADNEVEEVVKYLRSQGEPVYVDEVTAASDEEGGGAATGNGLNGGGVDADTSLFDQAVSLVAREGKASTSFIQRHLSIGYNRAAKLIEQMEKEGIVGPANHVGKREVLVRRTGDED
ncbi:DNA translocase FtsK [Acetobacteraceae bacterium KSS12]|uniref:DNA translocase FtsK n=2 Tax=Rhizosaccharibacter radicis TaxID=2782605 RepID=A0ABT1VSM1_9PROT|nr:DNA translocase FtsK [Acetobacteraceae bacterium KSS12]